MYAPVGITAGASSFDIAPSEHLNPELFDGMRMKPDVRTFLLGTLDNFLSARYAAVNDWLRSWMAGSGASYRWDAGHAKMDIDVLMGIDFIRFRTTNAGFTGMGDADIAQVINQEMREQLWPTTANWRDKYEITWYINEKSQDIRSINPYAAYDLVNDTWSVPPSKKAPEVSPEWELYASAYRARAERAVANYSQAHTELTNATNPAHRIDAEGRFGHAVTQAVSLFDNVHMGRKTAFSPVGKGYDDFGNFLWQAGKRDGWIEALKMIKQYHTKAVAEHQAQTYGMELPDHDMLVRRAALRYRSM